jgi:hypothetical protein
MSGSIPFPLYKALSPVLITLLIAKRDWMGEVVICGKK